MKYQFTIKSEDRFLDQRRIDTELAIFDWMRKWALIITFIFATCWTLNTFARHLVTFESEILRSMQ